MAAFGLKKALKEFFYEHPNEQWNYKELSVKLSHKFSEPLTEQQLSSAASALKKEWPGFIAAGQGFHLWNNTGFGVWPTQDTLPEQTEPEKADDSIYVDLDESVPYYNFVGSQKDGSLLVRRGDDPSETTVYRLEAI